MRLIKIDLIEAIFFGEAQAVQTALRKYAIRNRMLYARLEPWGA